MADGGVLDDDAKERMLKKLYGPERNLLRDNHVSFMRKDNVLTKEMAYDLDCPQESTTRASYRDPVLRRGREGSATRAWSSTAQHKTHISLGSDMSVRRTTVQADFTSKTPQFKGLVVPTSTHENHWTDCNPKFAVGKQTAPSVYGADFDGEKSFREWVNGVKRSGETVGRRSKTTTYQKATHFSLGSDAPSALSETQNQFAASDEKGWVCDAPPTQTGCEESGKQAQNMSKVFRRGDYNITHEDPLERFQSIQMKDYLPAPAKADVHEAFTGRDYQTSTHFQFGTARGSSGSVYHQDYIEGKPLTVPLRQSVPPPPPGKVLPGAEEAANRWGSTTCQETYRQHNIEQREQDRLAGMRTNHERHQALSVKLTCDKERNRLDRKSTTMTSSYSGHDATAPAEPAAPVMTQYRHLESNDALSNPTRLTGASEAQDSYRQLLNGEEALAGHMQGLRTERCARQHDNKKTHFHLGFACEENLSEQKSEYTEKSATDPNCPVAGQPAASSSATENYSIVSHEVDMCHQQGSEQTGNSVAESMQNVLLQRTLLKMDAAQDSHLMTLRRAFLEADKELCGTVPRGSVQAICRRLDVTLPENLNDLIEECDKDGQVDYHELTLQLSRSAQARKLADPHLASLTGRDYGDPRGKKLTPMQQLVSDTCQKRLVPSVATHYFHTHPSKGPLLSTARKDYIPPVLM